MRLPRLYPRAQSLLREGASDASRLSSSAGVMPSRTLRPGFRRPPPPQALASRQLEQVAQAVLLRVDPSGGFQFEVAMDDAALGPLTCHINMAGERVSAAFYSAAPETYRLLTAEKGRLRVMLTERGLRVGEVSVLDADPHDGRRRVP